MSKPKKKGEKENIVNRKSKQSYEEKICAHKNESCKYQVTIGYEQWYHVINADTCRKIGTSRLKETSKIVHCVSGEKKLYFKGKIMRDVTFRGKTLKVKVFILDNTINLFGID